MKLTKSKLRKLVVEEISQQTKKAELTKEGFIDTIKSVFGGKKESLHNDGNIIVERWQRLAGLIK